MELIDTPNPNAKKILVDHDYEIATYINYDSNNVEGIAKKLIRLTVLIPFLLVPVF